MKCPHVVLKFCQLLASHKQQKLVSDEQKKSQYMIMHLTKLFVAFFAIHSIKEKYAVNFLETYSTRVIIELNPVLLAGCFDCKQISI